MILFQNLRKKYYIPGELKTREEIEGNIKHHFFSLLRLFQML